MNASTWNYNDDAIVLESYILRKLRAMKSTQSGRGPSVQKVGELKTIKYKL